MELGICAWKKCNEEAKYEIYTSHPIIQLCEEHNKSFEKLSRKDTEFGLQMWFDNNQRRKWLKEEFW